MKQHSSSIGIDILIYKRDHLKINTISFDYQTLNRLL